MLDRALEAVMRRALDAGTGILKATQPPGSGAVARITREIRSDRQ